MFDIIRDDERTKEFEEEFNKIVPTFKDNKEKYTAIVKQKSLISWYISNKICSIRPGMIPVPERSYKENLDLSSFPVYNFLRNEDIEFTSGCGIDCFEKYSMNKECLILVDPPYINSCNAFYSTAKINIYEYIHDNNQKIYTSKIFFILENIWIIKLLFKTWSEVSIYNKTYQMHKKKTTHIIYKNIH